MPQVKVLIVDDHAVVRLGIRTAIENDAGMIIVGEAPDGETAIRTATVLQPDVVLMDVLMPGMDGIQTCRAIRDVLPNTRVLILTSHPGKDAVMSAIAAGASGYLLKNTGPAAIVNAVKTIHSGESMLDPHVTEQVLSEMRRLISSQQDNALDVLSERELEVLTLVGRGLNNREIAEKLFLSSNTARNHVSNILGKLGL
ncbi:MAG: response regulator transcription factor, partial [Chloroflexi bacterium]|nr:response regulator transcription factor [Chloroflexota bacterium]